MIICYNMEKKALEIAEQICKKKFEEKFQTKFDNNELVINKVKHDIIREQIKLWEEIGLTHLSQNQIEYEPPIKQALYYLCKQKIQWCNNKLLLE